MDQIARHRAEIDQIHKELRSLLERRRDATLAIWKIKAEQGLPFHHAEREAQILHDFANFEAESTQDPEFKVLLNSVMSSLLRHYETYLRSKFSGG